MGRTPQLERIAIGVPDLDEWIAAFSQILGPGFRKSKVEQSTGTVEIAIHPAGVEFVRHEAESARLRSFHLTVDDLGAVQQQVTRLGWELIDSVELEDRQHDIYDALGLRIILVERDAGRV